MPAEFAFPRSPFTPLVGNCRTARNDESAHSRPNNRLHPSDGSDDGGPANPLDGNQLEWSYGKQPPGSRDTAAWFGLRPAPAARQTSATVVGEFSRDLPPARNQLRCFFGDDPARHQSHEPYDRPTACVGSGQCGGGALHGRVAADSPLDG